MRFEGQKEETTTHKNVAIRLLMIMCCIEGPLFKENY